MKRIVEDIVDELRLNPYWDGLSCIEEMRDSGLSARLGSGESAI